MKHIDKYLKLPENTKMREKILYIQKIAKHPLIVIMWAPGIGKDTIVNTLLRENPRLAKLQRVTSREQKTRDQAWDFVYLTSKEIDKKSASGDVLFTYDSHRNDGSKYWIPYKELKKLEDQPLITTMGVWWLNNIKHYIPLIVCTLTRNEEDIIEALSNRHGDSQTWKNIQKTKENLERFLDQPLFTQLLIENTQNDIPKTVKTIQEVLHFFETNIITEKQQNLNNTLNAHLIDYINNEHPSLHDLEETILYYLHDDNGEINKKRLNEIVYFMYVWKFHEVRRYIQYNKNFKDKRNKRGIRKERELFYKKIAETIYFLWFHEEAKKILLQIWETKEPYKTQKNHTSRHNISKIEIFDCLKNLQTKYPYSYIEKDTMVFLQNNYKFWREASNLAKDTLKELFKTKNIEIKNTTHMRGTFKIKLLHPNDKIQYIKFQIIKDRV